MADWWIDETRPLSTEEAWEETKGTLGFEEPAARAPLAVALHDVTIHETTKLFGAATIRLDALFVTASQKDQIYQPGTFTFPGVRDHDDLPIGQGGLLLYLGRPRYFLDMSLIASRSVAGEKTLKDLLAEGSSEVGDLLGGVAELTYAAPHATAITTAAAAAAKLSAAVLGMLNQATGKSIGVYRTTWHEGRHKFGLGQHPPNGGRFRHHDLEFRYEVFEDRPQST